MPILTSPLRVYSESEGKPFHASILLSVLRSLVREGLNFICEKVVSTHTRMFTTIDNRKRRLSDLCRDLKICLQQFQPEWHLCVIAFFAHCRITNVRNVPDNGLFSQLKGKR